MQKCNIFTKCLSIIPKQNRLRVGDFDLPWFDGLKSHDREIWAHSAIGHAP